MTVIRIAMLTVNGARLQKDTYVQNGKLCHIRIQLFEMLSDCGMLLSVVRNRWCSLGAGLLVTVYRVAGAPKVTRFVDETRVSGITNITRIAMLQT